MKKFIASAMVGVALFTGCNGVESSIGESSQSMNEEEEEVPAMQNQTDLQIEDLVVGTGEVAKVGDVVEVHYVGTLEDGTKFDSSLDRGESFQFELGSGYVIQGWDLGVAGMKVGGKRKLIIPPHLAYGDQEVGGGLIPANSTLIFEVELLGIN